MATMTGERKRRYSKDDINNIVSEEGITSDDFTFLCALSNYAMVTEHPYTKKGVVTGMKSVDVVVLQTDKYPTGYFYEPGVQPVIVINEDNTILDYDFISELHPMHDWDVYLWLSHPWTVADTPLGIHGEWYRRDTYKDGMLPFNGKTLDWEDRNPNEEEDND